VSSASDELSLHDLLPVEQWKHQVERAVERIRAGAFEKVVLARSVRVMQEASFDIDATLQRLRQEYPSAYVFVIQRGERYFVGATPERLVCSEDGQIQTMALAGSAPRGVTDEEDQRFGAELLHSAKNQGEHQFVVTTIRDALSSLCSRVWVADAPRLLKLKNIQHLETPIMGNLLPGHSILETIENLHPTPAVGGYPRTPALAALREDEQLDRGWYAGPIGWIGTGGNGEFAVALRSGLVEGNQATLFAGCGIVADSDPESEYQESCLKLQVMLRGLGGEK
jgi:isochorismate synthase